MGQKIASLYAEIGADTSKLTKGLSETKTGLQKFGSTAKEAIGGFTTAIGIATGAAVLVKKALDFGAEGAQIEYTSAKFDRLSESIGTTSEALMKDLKGATSGMMSELELTASATDFLSLGLAKTHDEAVRLTSVAGQLGMNMNQLVLTLTNQTTMRFDALGVAVDGFDEKVEALKATGMSAEDAFNEAFLQQAEEQIKKVGSVADSSAADFMRMEAALQDAGAEIKTMLLPALTNAAVGLSGLLTNGKKSTEMLYDHNKAMSASSASYEEYSKEMERAAELVGYQINKNGDLVNSAGRVVDANFLVADSQREVNKQVNIWAAESGRYQGAADAYAESMMNVTDAAGDQLYTMEELNSLINGKLGKETEDYTETQEELRQKMSEINGEIETLLGQGWWEQSEKVQDLRGDYAELQDQIKENADEHEEATKRMLFDLLTQQATVDGLTVAEMTFLNELAGPNGWGLVDEATATASANATTALENIDEGIWTVDEALGLFSDSWNSLSSKDITLTTYINEIRTSKAQFDNTADQYTNQHRALGGPVFAGQSYLVGEQGPEVVTMGGNGNVTPNNQLMGGDIGAKIDAMSAGIDRLNRTLPAALKDAVLLAEASSGR